MMLELTAAEIEETKRLLATFESLHTTSPSLFDPLFEAGEVVVFPKNHVIMEPGAQLRDIYIIVDGLVGATYISENKIVMDGLAVPGTVLLHGGSFFRKSPSFMQWEALVQTKAIRIPDSAIRDYLHSNHEFAIWMYGLAENQNLYNDEKKFILSDSAEQRYLKLFNNLPRKIFRQLSSRVVARYLRITEQSLSRIKRKLIEEGKTDL